MATTNYGWDLPIVGGSTDTWGTIVNAAFDAADASLKTVADAAQPVDADLTAIAALAKTDGNFIVGNGTTWVAESGATARTSMGAYGAGSNASFGTIAATGAVTFSAGGTLGDASGDVVVLKGTTVHATSSSFLGNASASAWRTSLELGSIATQNSNNVTITGGTIQARTKIYTGVSGTIGASDAGSQLFLSGNVTVPAGLFSQGDIVILNANGSARTITQGSGLTLEWAGVGLTGNRTLAGNGIAALVFQSSSAARILGAGLS